MVNSIHSEKLSRGVTWSLIGHGTIFLVLILKSWVFPSTPFIHTPVLRVDVVGLPDILKKDLNQVSKNKPQSAEIERIVKETVAPDEMVLNPKKEVKEKEKKKEKPREEKMSSALARIRALEKIREETAEDSGVIIKGNQISKGSSLSGEAKESAESSYYDLVRDRLVDNWALPPWLARQKLSAQVVIHISSEGQVSKLQFTRPSGNTQFDEAIRASIKLSVPFPKPPKEVLTIVQDRGILVGFPL